MREERHALAQKWACLAQDKRLRADREQMMLSAAMMGAPLAQAASRDGAGLRDGPSLPWGLPPLQHTYCALWSVQQIQWLAVAQQQQQADMPAMSCCFQSAAGCYGWFEERWNTARGGLRSSGVGSHGHVQHAGMDQRPPDVDLDGGEGGSSGGELHWLLLLPSEEVEVEGLGQGAGMGGVVPSGAVGTGGAGGRQGVVGMVASRPQGVAGAAAGADGAGPWAPVVTALAAPFVGFAELLAGGVGGVRSAGAATVAAAPSTASKAGAGGQAGVSDFLSSDSGRRLSEQMAAEMSSGALMAPVYLTEELPGAATNPTHPTGS
eukprot:XP_001702210.1 predicted protein [Chlamydomonas reinhardtii]